MGKGKFKFVVWADKKGVDVCMDLCSQLYDRYDWSYYHAAHEICHSTKRDHIDGYYELEDARKWSTENNKFIKAFGKGGYSLETAKGTAGENLDYSEKEGRRFDTKGTPSKGQGARADLNALKEEVLAGKSVDEVCMGDPVMYQQYGS